MPVVETEAERRYEIEQIIASARLEGSEPTAAMQALMQRVARAEITTAEFLRQADELSANTDYAALARAQGAADDESAG